MIEETKLDFGEKLLLHTDFGPVSYGMIIGGCFMSISSEKRMDLVTSRIWDELYLYPSIEASDEELAKKPVKLTSKAGGARGLANADWNYDGIEDLIVTDRNGFLTYFKRTGEYPDIAFVDKGLLMDEEQKLYFNIPWENPNLKEVDNLGGYIDVGFFNYLYPVKYEFGDKNACNLIVGDLGGNLWWMPDVSKNAGDISGLNRKAAYKGIKYTKDIKKVYTAFGKKTIEQYGTEYVKPKEKICDEEGVPFLLGDTFENGKLYNGGNVRPFTIRNHITGKDDLLVLAGSKHQTFYYLQRSDSDKATKPVFQNLGKVTVSGLPEDPLFMNYHAFPFIFERDGWSELLLSTGNNTIAVCRNKRLPSIVPEFEYSHLISNKNVITSGYNFQEIFKDSLSNKSYILDFPQRMYFREIIADLDTPFLSSNKIAVYDQYGIFSPEGETDPYAGKDWGFHRAARWDFDGSGRNHLIVGTDKGLLYLLIDEGKLFKNGKAELRREGPLKDIYGNIIKIHNRTRACGIDMNSDGIEDLLVGGITYQNGMKTDPEPGAEFYCYINNGLDEKGIPVLSPLIPLEIRGHDFSYRLNSHIHIQTLDIDGDGQKEAILSSQMENFKGMVFKPVKDKVALEYTGHYIENFTIHEYLLDIDGDGEQELVFAGGETGVGIYQKKI